MVAELGGYTGLLFGYSLLILLIYFYIQIYLVIYGSRARWIYRTTTWIFSTTSV